MAPKARKGKGVASPSRGNKRKHVTHVTKERVCLVYALMIEMPVNVGAIIKDVLRISRVKKGQRLNFGDFLTRFLRGHQIEEEVVDYRPRFEKPLDDDDSTDKEHTRVDSDLDSDDDEDDSEKVEAALSPIDDED
ncbi:hypothetical protein HAX54_032088 [Datura stramonium]|uniref:Uncharacterized protein n=1 Tax=Datura stramonium TaxID=4076 RepID=A0ABS8SD82_DATST|nr:hypothetical protein [Datura stramonium]